MTRLQVVRPTSAPAGRAGRSERELPCTGSPRAGVPDVFPPPATAIPVEARHRLSYAGMSPAARVSSSVTRKP